MRLQPCQLPVQSSSFFLKHPLHTTWEWPKGTACEIWQLKPVMVMDYRPGLDVACSGQKCHTSMVMHIYTTVAGKTKLSFRYKSHGVV